MLASEYKDFEDITDTMQQALADKKIRMECEARERYERDRSSLYNSGHRAGHSEGRMEGQDIMAQLVSTLLEDNRIQDLKRVTTDKDYRNQLYREYGLSE